MKTTQKTLAAVLTALALSAGGIAYAASSPAKQQALQQASVSAAQAAQTAAAQIGGRAAAVDFKGGYYEADVVRGNETYEVRVDAKSGQVVRSKLDRDDDGVPPDVKITLPQAINAALQKTGGKVKEAGLKSKHGTAYYQVETLANGKEYKTVIDADSGAVLRSHLDD